MTIVMMLALACAQDAAEELNQAGSKAQEWKSYAFKSTTTTEGMPQRQNGGGNAGPRTSEGEYVAESKLFHSKSGNFESIRKGDKTAIKGRDGQWTAPQSGGGERQGRGGRGNFSVPPPHESLQGLGKAFKSVEKSTEGDLAVYSGELTPEGVQKLSGGGGRMMRGEVDATGTAKVWVDGEGRITKIEVQATVKGSMQGTDFEIKTHRTTEFSKFGEATFEIPEEAKKLFTD